MLGYLGPPGTFPFTKRQGRLEDARFAPARNSYHHAYSKALLSKQTQVKVEPANVNGRAKLKRPFPGGRQDESPRQGVWFEIYRCTAYRS